MSIRTALVAASKLLYNIKIKPDCMIISQDAYKRFYEYITTNAGEKGTDTSMWINPQSLEMKLYGMDLRVADIMPNDTVVFMKNGHFVGAVELDKKDLEQ